MHFILIASGLYYLAELVEEFTTQAARMIRAIILVSRERERESQRDVDSVEV
jgi:hypothetical protein